jgi:putative glutamate/gamma-aminobutyrate antiporter
MANRKVLGVFTLAMINVCAIASLKNFPMMAEYGWTLIFYLIVVAATFFIPGGLVSAELAAGWPPKGPGGVYIWVRIALGERWGFLAIWLQWVENVVWFPTILSFSAATLAYIINPALAENKFYTLFIIIIVFWGATILNLRGMKLSGLISNVGAIAGTIVPGALIIFLGIFWLATGRSSEITLSARTLIPNLGDLSQLVLLTGILLAFTGIEMSAVHRNSVKNPDRNFPRAIFLSTIIILAITAAGSLSVAIVVPQEKISLVAGVMEAFEYFFHVYHLDWLTPILALLIAAGGFAMVSTWIVGPTKGLFSTAEHGDLPPVFQKVNKQGMPVTVLIIQAVVLTIFSLVFLFMPSVSSSYWILTVLTAQIYLIMYVLLFLSAIVLRYKAPDTPRGYRVPGGNFGMWLVAGIGVLASGFGIVMGFIPPSQLKSGSILFYEVFLGSGVIVLACPPLIIYQFRKKSWRAKVKIED